MGTRISALWVLGACACSGNGSAAIEQRSSQAGDAAMMAAAGSGSQMPNHGDDLSGTDGPNGLTPIQPTSGNIGNCRAGHYVGTFSGDYHSGAWLDGSESITFATSDVDGHPGFEFWLESVKTPCTPGQEFCADAVVKGGKLRGNATPFSDPNDPSTQGGVGFSVRFEIDLTGELDCQHNKFKGKLENGCYDILSVLYRFDGTIDGDYVGTTSEFKNGVWHVDEQVMAGANMPAMPLGGDGMWTAAFEDDSAAPAGPGMGLCAGQSGFDTPQQ